MELIKFKGCAAKFGDGQELSGMETSAVNILILTDHGYEAIVYQE